VQGYTPLHVASLHGQLDIVLLLLQKGAGVDAATDLLHTALHFACQYNHDKVSDLSEYEIYLCIAPLLPLQVVLLMVSC